MGAFFSAAVWAVAIAFEATWAVGVGSAVTALGPLDREGLKLRGPFVGISDGDETDSEDGSMEG